MNILHLSAAKNWGGGENHIENLCLELNLAVGNIQNIILCVKDAGFHKKIKNGKLKVEAVPMLVKFDLRYVSKILSLTKKYNIDLIHIHDSTALTLGVMATKLGKLPPFVLSKKTSFPIKNRTRTLYKYNHPQINKILCVSEKTKEISSRNIEDHSKLQTIYHGTAIPKISSGLFNLRERLDLSAKKIIVGTVANHIRAKNLETWIEIINYVINIRKEKNFHFVQIGSYTDRSPKYKERIDKLNLSEHVSMLGFIPNASELISQFDISLITSQSEGIPQFIYESFYHKVPVISTNVGGIPEIIKDGENGFLTNAHEPQSLAEKLIALSRNKDLMKSFTERSYKKLIENFTTTKMAEQTLAEYKKVLYGKNGTGN
ncbi:glycosyltransferase family 4 protein [Christiangramia sabulilitoris]|uniref:Glycosyltransferase family 4 protein n=2 Tax=Christiangramia sabulilitoris TaxID=2583991 RepID=A0A550I466_9FLAO|nr:glycosyltransferase family 4 protein [Christiangramia sabulilitoris]